MTDVATEPPRGWELVRIIGLCFNFFHVEDYDGIVLLRPAAVEINFTTFSENRL